MNEKFSILKELIESYPNIKDFTKHRDICKEARRAAGYSDVTALDVIGRRLNKIRLSNDNPHASATDHEEDEDKRIRRKPRSVDDLMRRSNYIFSGAVIRRMMPDEEFKTFAAKYVATLDYARHVAITPPKREIEAFEKYDAGEISLREAMDLLGFKSVQHVKSTFGKIYAYKKECQRAGAGHAVNELSGDEGGSGGQGVSDREAGQSTATPQADTDEGGSDLRDHGQENPPWGIRIPL